jgi:hypothetical protein
MVGFIRPPNDEVQIFCMNFNFHLLTSPLYHEFNHGLGVIFNKHFRANCDALIVIACDNMYVFCYQILNVD